MLLPHKIFFLVLVSFLAFTERVSAYPQFIGYKYSSCITCHYNGQGNGALSDYGRALWAAEIAGRAFVSKKSDEQLGEESGFLGSRPLPWWVRPGFKARHLAYQVNPPDGKMRQITMQAEANLAIFLDQDQKYTFVGSYGYVPPPERTRNQPGPKPDTWISREHYLRIQTTQDLWLYIGMMDKVYGIRIADHTAFSRSRTGLAQNDQTHGVMAHYITPKWELTLHGFLGNLFQDEDLRQMGASSLFEYEVREAWRVGVTALYSNNNYVRNQRLGVLSRYGLGHGSSVLAEVGVLEDALKGGSDKMGYYLYSEVMQKLVRGYHSFVSAQLYKDTFNGGRPDNVRTSIGLLAFPVSRTELRIELENRSQMTNSAQVQRDIWAFLAQLHLSL